MSSANEQELIPNFLSQGVRNFLDEQIISANLEYFSNDNEESAEVDTSVANWRLPDLKPLAVESFSVVVMADVSGYSKLTAFLAERGNAGTDLLAKTMKSYMDKIISIIIKHQGDIVKFAGDAVVVYWKLEMDADEIEEADKRRCVKNESIVKSKCSCIKCIKGAIVLKASICCLDLLKELGRFFIDERECGIGELNIHLGIGAGELYDVHVKGDDTRYEQFVAGDAVNQLAVVLNLAKPQQLALSHSAWQYLKHVVDINNLDLNNYDKRCVILAGLEKDLEVRGRTKAEDYARIPSKGYRRKLYKRIPLELRVELYQKYINQSVLVKLKSGLDTLLTLNELRQTTTLFLRIGDLKFQGEQLDDTQNAMAIVQSVMRKYDGSLRQFHVDDKGAVILAFFGLPPLAHENDAIYGVQAAMEIAKMFKIFEDFSIGVTTGVVSIGGVGNNVRTEYALMGDCINMAARLMFLEDAMCNILCDERTHQLCEHAVDFRTLPSATVKGKKYPIKIFQPIAFKNNVAQRVDNNRRRSSAHQEHSNDAAMHEQIIGRIAEKEAAEKMFESHSLGQVAALVVQGEAGSGVSTFSNFVRGVAEKRGFYTCSGVGSELNKNQILYAFQDILCDLFSLIGSEDFPDLSKTSGSGNLLLPNALHVKGTNAAAASTDFLAVKGSTLRLGLPQAPLHASSVSLASGIKNKALLSVMSKVNVKRSMMGSRSLMSDSVEASRELHPTDQPPSVSASRSIELQNIGENDTSFERIVKKALVKVGASAEDAVLLVPLFPLEFSSTSSIRRDQQSGELSRLILKIISAVSSQVPLVLTFGEAQWVDLTSWALIEDILRLLPRVIVGIFSRFEALYEHEAIVSRLVHLKSRPTTVCLTMNMLTEEELGAYVLAIWTEQKPIPATAINPTVLREIYARSGGNPLHARSIFVNMIESNMVFLGEDDIILPYKRRESLVISTVQTNMPTPDFQTIVISQLDRLDVKFQHLLKVAAIIGDSFFTEDVVSFLPKSMRDIDEHSLQAFDRYSFLRKDSDGSNTMYSFRSSFIRSSIYNMMSQTQRQQLHFELAQHYERITENDPIRRERLLITIFEHYNLSKNPEKTRTFLEKVCLLYKERRALDEAVLNYQELLEMTKNSIIPSNDADDSHVALMKRCQWIEDMCLLLFVKDEYESAIARALDVLRLLDFNLPERGWSLNFALWKDAKMPPSCSTRKWIMEEDRARQICRILIHLAIFYHFTDDSEMSRITALMAAQISETFGFTDGLQARILVVRDLLKVIYGGANQQVLQRNAAMDLTMLKVPEDLGQVATVIGSSLFLTGVFDAAREKINSVTELRASLLNQRWWYQAAILQSWVDGLLGTQSAKMCEALEMDHLVATERVSRAFELALKCASATPAGAGNDQVTVIWRILEASLRIQREQGFDRMHAGDQFLLVTATVKARLLLTIHNFEEPEDLWVQSLADGISSCIRISDQFSPSCWIALYGSEILLDGCITMTSQWKTCAETVQKQQVDILEKLETLHRQLSRVLGTRLGHLALAKPLSKLHLGAAEILSSLKQKNAPVAAKAHQSGLQAWRAALAFPVCQKAPGLQKKITDWISQHERPADVPSLPKSAPVVESKASNIV